MFLPMTGRCAPAFWLCDGTIIGDGDLPLQHHGPTNGEPAPSYVPPLLPSHLDISLPFPKYTRSLCLCSLSRRDSVSYQDLPGVCAVEERTILHSRSEGHLDSQPASSENSLSEAERWYASCAHTANQVCKCVCMCTHVCTSVCEHLC